MFRSASDLYNQVVEAAQNQELWEKKPHKPGENEIRCSAPFRIYITFARGNTRSGINQKLNHPRTSSVTQHHFYFNRIARLYNYLPVIDLSLSTSTIKYRLTNYLWSHFTNNFNPERACTFHLLCPCHRCSRAPISTNFNKL